MPISLLRKRQPEKEPEVAPSIAALSLPDCTAPLIGPDAWAQAHPPPTAPLPSQPLTHSSASNVVPPVPGRHPGRLAKNPNGNGKLAPVPRRDTLSREHSRGESDDGLDEKENARGRAPSFVRDAHGGSPNFHRPFSGTVAPSLEGHELGRAGTMRRARARRAAALTVIVAGPSGSGKSSFIDALSGVLDPAAPRVSSRTGPTTSVVRHEANMSESRRSVVLLDTPGLPPGDSFTTATRQRALNALLGIVEERLSRVLAEEAKVVRKKSDGGELIHLIIYVMDARTVLCPIAPVAVDWETVHEPPVKGVPRPESAIEPDSGDVAARLSVEDIEAMRRFSGRANVLPVLTHADALTTQELNAVRGAVRRDLSTVFGREPLGAWGVLCANDMEDEDDESERASTPSGRLSRASRASELDHSVPYVVFAPEPGPGFTRAFRWGRADAADPAHSDLSAVRDTFVEAAEWLRTSTREVVYERFRTERLLTARGARSLV